MGYACPVCGDPQSDGRHLANHLAFTAMLGDAGHEAWLDEHAPDWAESGPEDLAPVVTDLAEETEYPQVFEDTTDDGRDRGRDRPGGQGHAREHDHGPGPGHDHSHQHRRSRGPAPDELLEGASPGEVPDPSTLFDPDADEEAAADVYQEARELTERRRANLESSDAGDAGDTSSTEEDDAGDTGSTESDDADETGSS